MRRLFAMVIVAITMVVGVSFTAATAGERGERVRLDTVTSSYSQKKDKAYWTRVWYQKQVKRGRYKKVNGRYVRTKKSTRRAAKRSTKRRSAKRRSKSRNAYAGGTGRVLAKVDLSAQRMNVYRGGKRIHSWPVSTGRKGYRTPTGTWKVHRMHKEYYSKKYDNAPMPYAMFYSGGFAIHGTNAISRLGRPASHGCVRLHPSNAAALFAMIKRSGGTVKVTR